jgi:hypothetical protein
LGGGPPAEAYGAATAAITSTMTHATRRISTS